MANDARDSANSAQARLRGLQDQLSTSTLTDEQQNDIEKEIDRLIARRSAGNERNAALLALVNNLRRYVQALPRGVNLESVKFVRPDLLKGETAADALARIRDEITAVKGHRLAAANATPPKAARKAAMRAWVKEQAQLGAPTNLTIRDGKFEATFGTAKSFVPASVKGAAQLFAWIDPEAFAKRLEDAIDAMPEAAVVMSAAEREQRLADLAADLDRLERDEEGLIEALADDGIEAPRRPEANPAAVLGVRSKQRARVRAD
jgi:hypothetical protein